MRAKKARALKMCSNLRYLRLPNETNRPYYGKLIPQCG